MAGIEHRRVDTILQAFDHFAMPNYAIYSGNEQRDYYDGGNVDDGRNKLEQWLNMIEQSGTNTVYTLRVYPEAVKEIDRKTVSKGSTTFKLEPPGQIMRQDGGGVTIVNPGGGRLPDRVQGYQEDSNAVKELRLQVEKLREENHKKDLDNLRTEFNSQIAGLNQPPEKTWIDRIEGLFDRIIEKPEIVEKIAGIFRPKKDFIQYQPINGTEKTTEHMEPQQYEIPVHTFAELQAMTDDELKELQDAALESIAARITEAKLTEMILAVARMDDKNLNKLLNHLD